jgi:multisubunit Na+/H+ antiporter MnhG subunit
MYVMRECTKFFLIFSAMMVLFSYIGFLLFSQIYTERFSSWSQSLMYLIEVLFAQFAFLVYQEQYPISSAIFLFIYLFFASILLMNLLTAILALTFEKATTRGRTLFFYRNIRYVRMAAYHQNLGFLTVMPIII